MIARRFVSHQRTGASLTPFYFDSARPEAARMAIVDDFGDITEAGIVYGDCDVDIDDVAHEEMWPARFLPEGHPFRVAREQLPQVVEPAPAAPKPPALDWLGYQRLKRKLDAWELDHLREHAAEQAAEIERQAARIQQLERWLGDSQASADMWHHHALDLGDELRASGAGTIGLSRDGALHVLPASVQRAEGAAS